MNTPRHAAAVGAAIATLGAFPTAAFVALVYRFPIPFGGYRSGVEAVGPALLAVLFYGLVLGGFIVLPCCGAIVGLLAYRRGKPSGNPVLGWMIGGCLGVDAVAAMTLAVWDKVYGRW